MPKAMKSIMDRELPEEAGRLYFRFRNVEASVSFLWHKTRTNAWESLKWRLPLLLHGSNSVEISPPELISSWIIVSVCRKMHQLENAVHMKNSIIRTYNINLINKVNKPEVNISPIFLQQILLPSQQEYGEDLLHQLQRSPRIEDARTI